MNEPPVRSDSGEIRGRGGPILGGICGGCGRGLIGCWGGVSTGAGAGATVSVGCEVTGAGKLNRGGLKWY